MGLFKFSHSSMILMLRYYQINMSYCPQGPQTHNQPKIKTLFARRAFQELQMHIFRSFGRPQGPTKTANHIFSKCSPSKWSRMPRPSASTKRLPSWVLFNCDSLICVVCIRSQLAFQCRMCGQGRRQRASCLESVIVWLE